MDWAERIQKAEQREFFNGEDYKLAKEWSTCVVSELDVERYNDNHILYGIDILPKHKCWGFPIFTRLY